MGGIPSRLLVYGNREAGGRRGWEIELRESKDGMRLSKDSPKKRFDLCNLHTWQ